VGRRSQALLRRHPLLLRRCCVRIVRCMALRVLTLATAAAAGLPPPHTHSPSHPFACHSLRLRCWR
jgi:hypothetical protein